MKLLTILSVNREIYMPQIDRHKNRTVYIEFVAAENFNNLPYEDRLTIIFITSGSINVQLNDRPIKIVAPSILCLSMDDTYFIKQFTAKRGMTPTEFRNTSREFANC